MWAHTLPRIEIYGTEGSLSVPDPNNFGGEVRVRRMGETEWRDVNTGDAVVTSRIISVYLPGG